MNKVTMITLSNAMDKYYPNYQEILKEKNLLSISPTGSGKTYWIFNHLLTDKTKKYLYLCDTSNLKRMVMKEPNVWDSDSKVLNDEGELVSVFGRKNILAMTYWEFDQTMKRLGKNKPYKKTDEQLKYISQFNTIICDEIHSLFSYEKFTKDSYYYAINRLKDKYDTTKIIWLTATPQTIYDYQERMNKKYKERLEEYNDLCEEGITNEYINPFPKEPMKILQNFITIEFTPEEHNIKHYLNIRLDYIRDYKDIPNEIRKCKEYFKYANGKMLIYINEIDYMKIVEEWLNEIEYIKSIAIWSENNSTKPMTKEQDRVRKHIISTEYFPNEYNCIIINDAMLTGVNIEDENVKRMIAVSSDETKITQSRGRIRQDIDLLIIRAKNSTELNQIKLLEHIDIDKVLAKYTSKEATKEELEQLILKYDLRDKVNSRRQLTVSKLLKELQSLGYTVDKKSKRNKENKQRTVYIITKAN